MSDSSKILFDLTHTISQVRPNLTTLNDKSVKEVVEKITPVQFLFDTELGEKVETQNAMVRASNDLKSNKALPCLSLAFRFLTAISARRGGAVIQYPQPTVS